MKAAQLCPTLCDPIDYTAHRILQARILEWVAIPTSPGDLFNPGITPRSPALQADSLLAEPPGKPGITLILIKSPGFCLENFKHNIHLRAFASNYVVFHLHQINHG